MQAAQGGVNHVELFFPLAIYGSLNWIHCVYVEVPPAIIGTNLGDEVVLFSGFCGGSGDSPVEGIFFRGDFAGDFFAVGVFDRVGAVGAVLEIVAFLTRPGVRIPRENKQRS